MLNQRYILCNDTLAKLSGPRHLVNKLCLTDEVTKDMALYQIYVLISVVEPLSVSRSQLVRIRVHHVIL